MSESYTSNAHECGLGTPHNAGRYGCGRELRRRDEAPSESSKALGNPLRHQEDLEIPQAPRAIQITRRAHLSSLWREAENMLPPSQVALGGRDNPLLNPQRLRLAAKCAGGNVPRHADVSLITAAVAPDCPSCQ